MIFPPVKFVLRRMAPAQWYGEKFHPPRRVYQTRTEKQTGLWPVFSRAGDIRLVGRGNETLSRPIYGHTPRKLPSGSMQSPASPHYAPCTPCRRSIRISKSPSNVKGDFTIFQIKICGFLRIFRRGRKIGTRPQKSKVKGIISMRGWTTKAPSPLPQITVMCLLNSWRNWRQEPQG